MELNCFTVFPLGNYLNKISVYRVAWTQKLHTYLRLPLGDKNTLLCSSKDMSYSLTFQWDQLSCDSTPATTWKKAFLLFADIICVCKTILGLFFFFFQSTPWISIFKIVKKKKVSNWIYSEMEKDISMHSCLICMWKFLSGHKVVFMQSWRRWLLNDHFLEANSIFIYFSYILIYLVLSILSLNNINLKNNFYF